MATFSFFFMNEDWRKKNEKGGRYVDAPAAHARMACVDVSSAERKKKDRYLISIRVVELQQPGDREISAAKSFGRLFPFGPGHCIEASGDSAPVFSNKPFKFCDGEEAVRRSSALQLFWVQAKPIVRVSQYTRGKQNSVRDGRADVARRNRRSSLLQNGRRRCGKCRTNERETKKRRGI